MCQKVKCLLKVFLVGRDGVEPPQEYPADLQSVELATCTASPFNLKCIYPGSTITSG